MLVDTTAICVVFVFGQAIPLKFMFELTVYIPLDMGRIEESIGFCAPDE